MKHIFSIFTIFVLFISSTVLAETQCPPGTTQSTDINNNPICVLSASPGTQCPPGTTLSSDPVTRQPTCVPEQPADPYATQRPSMNTDFNAGNTTSGLQTLDEQKKTAREVAERQFNANEQSNNDFFDNVSTPTRERARRKQEAYSWAARTGWVLDAGLGYGTVAEGIVHLGLGYIFDRQFPSPTTKFIHFGLFTGLDIISGWPATWNIDWNIMPKLIMNWGGPFQFSSGLGIALGGGEYDGLFLTGFFDEYDYFLGFTFTIKPTFEFDWFVHHNWFVGFAFDLSFIFNTITECADGDEKCHRDLEREKEEGDNTYFDFRFDLYFHFGYKF